MKRWIGIVVTGVAIGAIIEPIWGITVVDPRFYFIAIPLTIVNVLVWRALLPSDKE